MSYDLMFKKAIELQNAGALNEAEAIYSQLLEMMPQNSDVWNLLGLIAQSREDNLRAVDCFLTAIKYAPVPFAAHFFNLGLSYKSLNKPAEAKEALLRATALAPTLKEGWNFLGLLQAETQDISAAVKSFCKALEIDDDYMDARANLCYYTNDLETLTKLADENPLHFQANYQAGLGTPDLVKKEHYLRLAAVAAPERTDGLLALAQALNSAEKLDEALIYYHKVLNLNNKDIQALLGAADIYLMQDQLEKAEKLYKQSFDITIEIAGAHLNYGILLYRQKRLSEALEQYRAAAALAPERAEISYNLALILKETGDVEEALGLMFNAHLKMPQNQLFAINIAETLADLFDKNAELALKIAENWHKQEPDNIFAQRLLTGMSGMENQTDDKTYAEGLFDAFADSYEQTVSRLQPQIIDKFKELAGNLSGTIIDLGCGTGLTAAALKNEDTVFDGVDVSAQMLSAARQKGLYRQLFHSDIVSFLRQNPLRGHYNMALAFDVFCYFGELQEVFSLLAGTEIWFSVELADDSQGKNYYLAPNGRYKHARDYVERALKTCGLQIIHAESLVLRQENGGDVLGVLFHAK